MRLPIIAAALGVLGLSQLASAQSVPSNTHLAGAAESLDFERNTDGAERQAALAGAERVREAQRKRDRARPAKPGEVTAGRAVHDARGVPLGTVESAGMSAAVVATSVGKVEVPLDSFGLNAKGLLLGLTKAEFDALVADANKPAE
jgi:hypothetical protein